MLGLLPRVDKHQLADIPGTTTSRAAQACVTCRKQKRKCDKSLPTCSRCASLQRICDYSDGGPAAVPTADDFAALQRKLAQIEERLNSRPEAQNSSTPSGSDTYVESSAPSLGPSQGDQPSAPSWTNRFPSVLFLDTDVYKYTNMVPPKPEVDIPTDVFEILSSGEVIQEAASTYFNTVHKWFSFVSRKRMNLGISLVGGGPDLILLFLAIKLITTPPPLQPQSADKLTLYRTTKNFLHLLEAAGTTSILYLQSQILVALYEYSHALYPSAYLSVGACVRYASLLGLPSYAEASAVLGPCTTWTEAEERRRTWWAVHILDRIVSLGSKRPFAGGPAAPPPTEFLPTDDSAWDAGDMGRALQRPLSTPLDEPTNSPFARLAQAAVLISKAMAHCRRATGPRNPRRRRSRRRRGGHDNGDRDANDEQGADEEDIAAGGANDDDDDDAGGGARPSVNIREVTALVKELDALCKACHTDMQRAGAAPGTAAYFGFFTARCVAWSTAMMVLDLYSCPEHMRPGGATTGGGAGGPGGPSGAENGGAPSARSAAELALQVEAINGLRTAALHVCEESAVLLGLFEGAASSSSLSSSSVEAPGAVQQEDGGSYMDWSSVFSNGGTIDAHGASAPVEEKEEDLLAGFSPLCLDVIYCGMSTCGWLWRESGDAEMKGGLEVTRRCLEKIGTRWRLADAYLEVGKKQDGVLMELMGLNGA